MFLKIIGCSMLNYTNIVWGPKLQLVNLLTKYYSNYWELIGTSRLQYFVSIWISSLNTLLLLISFIFGIFVNISKVQAFFKDTFLRPCIIKKFSCKDCRVFSIPLWCQIILLSISMLTRFCFRLSPCICNFSMLSQFLMC